MKELFKMSDLGLLTYYLGIEVHQKPEGITLCQEAYERRFLKAVAWRTAIQVMFQWSLDLNLARGAKHARLMQRSIEVWSEA